MVLFNAEVIEVIVVVLPLFNLIEMAIHIEKLVVSFPLSNLQVSGDIIHNFLLTCFRS